jgi:hypothetical protein
LVQALAGFRDLKFHFHGWFPAHVLKRPLQAWVALLRLSLIPVKLLEGNVKQRPAKDRHG